MLCFRMVLTRQTMMSGPIAVENPWGRTRRTALWGGQCLPLGQAHPLGRPTAGILKGERHGRKTRQDHAREEHPVMDLADGSPCEGNRPTQTGVPAKRVAHAPAATPHACGGARDRDIRQGKHERRRGLPLNCRKEGGVCSGKPAVGAQAPPSAAKNSRRKKE